MFDSIRENFEIILVGLFLLSTIAYFIYQFTFKRDIRRDIASNREHLNTLTRKERKQMKYNIGANHTNTLGRKFIFFFADLFWVLLFVVVMRSFIFEPFVIPSGSMKPGLQVGDVVLVNKYEKGLRLPVFNSRLSKGDPVERGDVLVFKYPKNTKVSYIKRVIGLPGDKVYYDNRKMTINGKRVKLRLLNNETDKVEVNTRNGLEEKKINFTVYEENFGDKRHLIRYSKKYPARYPARDWIVPAGKYLVMGDNRDNSADGRAFGYLDDKLVIGRATRIALNWHCFVGDGECDRFFKKIL